ncbi:MAG TPA: methyltransferase domain-containing protein [Bryobacteraceae bacterium]|nr:methyltransferase domain-containing protein [Bryobacteraceae bacterium]
MKKLLANSPQNGVRRKTVPDWFGGARRTLCRLSCLFLLCAAAFPQVAEKANEGYKTKEGRAGVAKGLAAPDREARQHPREIVDAMGLKVGDAVADVGTGVGFMLPYLSHVVGATGTVYAEDIQTDFLDQARSRAQLQQLTNVKFVLGTDRDPKLPAATLEGILVLDVYHHFDYPEAMLEHIRDSLLSDGKLTIVEFYKRRGAMGNGDRALEHIRLDQDDLIKEVEANGFRLVSKSDVIPNSQYMVIFQKK